MLGVIRLETPQWKWASFRLDGRTSWIFSICGRCSRVTTGTSGTRSGGLSKGHSACELLGGLSGFHSLRCRGLRPCVVSVPEPEGYSPVLTRILGYSWRLQRGFSPQLEWEYEREISSRSVAAVLPFPFPGKWICGFLSRLSQAFPRGFPTGVSHVPPWC